jgi:CRP/FNR family transcriptional regulator, anaerobic regulatory protein
MDINFAWRLLKLDERWCMPEQQPSPGESTPGTELSCRSCALNRICLPAHLSPHEARVLDGAVERGRKLATSASLVRAGMPMQALYVIRSGSAKSYCLTTDGEERVRGFHLPGEVVGLEGFAEGRHLCEVVALEPVHCCRIPVQRLERLMETLPGLRREILRLLGKSLDDAQRRYADLGVTDARGRIARFLVDLSQRLECRGLSATQFRLSMSRGDIARHLGLTLETVSRVLAALKREGSIEVQARYIKLLDLHALASPASGR